MNELRKLHLNVLNLYKDTLEMKAKYIRRTGSAGNYKYEYADGSKTNDKKNSQLNPTTKKILQGAYKENEDANAHTENALLLAKQFGSKKEVNEIKEILKRQEKNQGISETDNKFNSNINKKYYNLLFSKN